MRYPVKDSGDAMRVRCWDFIFFSFVSWLENKLLTLSTRRIPVICDDNSVFRLIYDACNGNVTTRLAGTRDTNLCRVGVTGGNGDNDLRRAHQMHLSILHNATITRNWRVELILITLFLSNRTRLMKTRLSLYLWFLFIFLYDIFIF